MQGAIRHPARQGGLGSQHHRADSGEGHDAERRGLAHQGELACPARQFGGGLRQGAVTLEPRRPQPETLDLALVGGRLDHHRLVRRPVARRLLVQPHLHRQREPGHQREEQGQRQDQQAHRRGEQPQHRQEEKRERQVERGVQDRAGEDVAQALELAEAGDLLVDVGLVEPVERHEGELAEEGEAHAPLDAAADPGQRAAADQAQRRVGRQHPREAHHQRQEKIGGPCRDQPVVDHHHQQRRGKAQDVDEERGPGQKPDLAAERADDLGQAVAGRRGGSGFDPAHVDHATAQGPRRRPPGVLVALAADQQLAVAGAEHRAHDPVVAGEEAGRVRRRDLVHAPGDVDDGQTEVAQRLQVVVRCQPRGVMRHGGGEAVGAAAPAGAARDQRDEGEGGGAAGLDHAEILVSAAAASAAASSSHARVAALSPGMVPRSIVWSPRASHDGRRLTRISVVCPRRCRIAASSARVGRVVERAVGLVEEQHPGSERERPRDGDALQEAAGGGVVSCRHRGVVAPGQAVHVGLEPDLARDLHGLGGRLRVAEEGDVVEDRALEDHRIGVDIGDLAAPARLAQGRGIAPVDQDAAGIGRRLAQHHPQKRGLARAVGPGDGEAAARGHLGVQPLEPARAVGLPEGHVPQHDLAPQRVEMRVARLPLRRDEQVAQLVARGLDRLGLHPEAQHLQHRLYGAAVQQHASGQLADADRAPDDHVAAEKAHRGHRRLAEDRAEGLAELGDEGQPAAGVDGLVLQHLVAAEHLRLHRLALDGHALRQELDQERVPPLVHRLALGQHRDLHHLEQLAKAEEDPEAGDRHHRQPPADEQDHPHEDHRERQVDAKQAGLTGVVVAQRGHGTQPVEVLAGVAALELGRVRAQYVAQHAPPQRELVGLALEPQQHDPAHPEDEIQDQHGAEADEEDVQRVVRPVRDHPVEHLQQHQRHRQRKKVHADRRRQHGGSDPRCAAGHGLVSSPSG